MFLNYIKNYFVKNKLKNSELNSKTEIGLEKVKTIGLIVDETNFSNTSDLINRLVLDGFSKNDIKVIVYKNKIDTKQQYDNHTFGYNVMHWNGKISDTTVNEFMQTEFDLLISYYDTEKPLLVLITNNSKSKFKVGFSSIDSKWNHLMINTSVKKHDVFVYELIKYLKILKKIES
jgi:hypothetical protein